MNAIKHSLLLGAALLLAACNGRRTVLPSSSGTPFDVILMGDSDSIVRQTLEADVPGLPQCEPLFHVTEASPRQTATAARLARSIVVVDIDPRQYTRVALRRENNVYATPQIVVHLHAPDPDALRRYLSTDNTLVRLLLRHEYNAEIARLRSHHNPKAEAAIQRMFGCTMSVPSTMTASLQGKDFIWLSDNSAYGMANICVYTSENRDSVMRANIKGETDDMYMTTVAGSVTRQQVYPHGQTVCVTRGLWEMKGDAMGGPFVSHTVTDSLTGKTIVAEAFVYAPSMPKRNLLLRAEAALYTLRTAPQKPRRVARGK